MKLDDITAKELESLWDIDKRRKAQLSINYKTAWNSYLTAPDGNSSVEYRDELVHKAHVIEGRLSGKITKMPIAPKFQNPS